MATSPVRLVCPDCDTIHRVRSVTPGKPYRCKKCGAGLLTLAPAVLVCPDCGAATAPAHVDISRVATCGACEHAPALKLASPAEVSAAEPSVAPAKAAADAGGEEVSAVIAAAVEGAVGQVLGKALAAGLPGVVRDAISQEVAKNRRPFSEEMLARVGEEGARLEERLVEACRRELSQRLAASADELARRWREEGKERGRGVRAELEAVLADSVQRELSDLATVIGQRLESLERLQQEGASLQLGEARTARAIFQQELSELRSSIEQAVAGGADPEQVEAAVGRALQGVGQRLEAATAQRAREAARLEDLLSAGVATLRVEAERVHGRLADLEPVCRALHELREELPRVVQSTVGQVLAGVPDQERVREIVEDALQALNTRVHEIFREWESAVGNRDRRISGELDNLRADLESVRAGLPDDARLLAQMGRIEDALQQALERLPGEEELERVFARRLREALAEQAAKLAAMREEREAEIAQRVQQELDRALASVPEGGNVGELGVSQVIAETIGLHLGEYLEQARTQTQEAMAELRAQVAAVAREQQQELATRIEAVVAEAGEPLASGVMEIERRQQQAAAGIAEALQRLDDSMAGGAARAETVFDPGEVAAAVEERMARSLAGLTDNLGHEIDRRLQGQVTAVMEREAGAAVERAMAGLPRLVDEKVVTPLGRDLAEQVPRLLERLQDEEVTRAFNAIARESRQEIVAEMRQATGATIAWIAKVTLPIILLLFAPLAYVAWQVRGGAVVAGRGPGAADDTGAQRLEALQRQLAQLTAIQSSRVDRLEHELAAADKARQNLVRQNLVLTRDNRAFAKTLEQYKQAIEQWRANGDKWQNLAQKHYARVQELERRLRQLGVKLPPPSKPTMPGGGR